MSNNVDKEWTFGLQEGRTEPLRSAQMGTTTNKLSGVVLSFLEPFEAVWWVIASSIGC